MAGCFHVVSPLMRCVVFEAEEAGGACLLDLEVPGLPLLHDVFFL